MITRYCELERPGNRDLGWYLGLPTKNQEQVSAGMPTEDQAGLVAALWCWDAESLGHWVVEVANDVGSHVSLCGLHGTSWRWPDKTPTTETAGQLGQDKQVVGPETQAESTGEETKVMAGC